MRECALIAYIHVWNIQIPEYIYFLQYYILIKNGDKDTVVYDG